MSAILLTAPATEPVSLDEMRAFLRVEHHDDDEVIAALAVGARLHVEAATRRALITQNWRLAFDAWPASGRLEVRPGPLRSLAAARVYDLENVAHDVDTQAFIPDLGASALIFAPWAVPQPGRPKAGIEIDVAAGYGDAAADAPEPLRQAIRLLTAHWYDNRGLVAIGHETAVLPQTVAALIAPYRMLSL